MAIVSLRPENGDVRWFGRIGEQEGGVLLPWTDSGFAARFRGTSLQVELSTNVWENENARPYLGVFLDGADQPAAMRQIAVDQPGRAWYTLAEGLPDGEHTLLLVKLSEALQSVVVAYTADTDGELLLPPESGHTRRLEFVGDSITTGFGNVCPDPNGPFSTKEQDGWQSYAALTARALDADFHVLAVSGFAAYKSPFGDAVPPLYPYIDGLQSCRQPWDFARFQPDAVVINLGTNDGSWMVNEVSAAIPMEEKREAFIETYIRFLGEVRARNPRAKILCTIGMLNTVSIPDVERAVERAREAGLADVAYLRLPEAEAYGAGHPASAAHQAAAAVLAPYLRDWLGW